MDEAASPSDRLEEGEGGKERRPPARNSGYIYRKKEEQEGRIESKDVKEVGKITRTIFFRRCFSLLFGSDEWILTSKL